MSSHHSHHHHHHKRPRRQTTGVAVAACVVLFVAFLLFLLVALSSPIIKRIFLLIINFNAQPGQAATTVVAGLEFGVWGFCSTIPLPLSTILVENSQCTAPHLGYTLPQDLLNLTGYPQIVNAVLEVLTLLLVLHPVTAGLSGFTTFCSLFVKSRCMIILATIGSILTAIAGSVVLAADLALVIEAKNKIGPLTNGEVTVNWGSGVWIIVAAVALSWLGVMLLGAVACGCFGLRRIRDDWDDDLY